MNRGLSPRGLTASPRSSTPSHSPRCREKTSSTNRDPACERSCGVHPRTSPFSLSASRKHPECHPPQNTESSWHDRTLACPDGRSRGALRRSQKMPARRRFEQESQSQDVLVEISRPLYIMRANLNLPHPRDTNRSRVFSHSNPPLWPECQKPVLIGSLNSCCRYGSPPR